jgi:TM2 domain-containing membrane protein YozV
MPDACLVITHWQAEPPALLNSAFGILNSAFWFLTLCSMPYALCLLKSAIRNPQSEITLAPLLQGFGLIVNSLGMY